MNDKWKNILEFIEVDSDPLGLAKALENARALADIDPQEASQVLSSVTRDLKDTILPIESLVFNLEEKIPTWTEKSTQRLIDATQKYFDQELRRIENAIDEDVGYGTQFTEMKEAISTQFFQWNDKRKFKNAVKKFFIRSENDPARKKEWAKWCNRRDHASYFEEYLEETHIKIDDEIRTSEKQKVRDEISRIENLGLSQYVELERTNFFEVDPESQKQKLEEFDSRLVEDFCKRGWIKTKPQLKYGTGFVGVLLEQSFGEEALNSFRDSFFSDENKRFESFWKAEVFQSLQKIPFVKKSLLPATGNSVEACITPEAATAVFAAVAPLVGAGVLAAGWHTMAWAMSNFFPPMLLVTIPITVAAVIMGKEKTGTSMKREARNFCDRMLSSQKLSIQGNYRNQAEKTARKFVENFRVNAYKTSVGLSSKRKVYKFFKSIDEICSPLNSRISPSRVDFLGLCYESLKNGNGFDAASLSVQAYEACVEQWLERVSLPSPRQSDFLRRSIDLLRRHPDVPKNVTEQLDLLRRVRNRWAHGMRDLVELSEEERKRRVVEVLDSLRSVMPQAFPSRGSSISTGDSTYNV